MIIEKVVPDFCGVGEAAYWNDDDKCTYYVDIIKRRLLRFNSVTMKNSFIQLESEGRLGLIVPIKGEKDQFVFGQGQKLYKLVWPADSEDFQIEELLTISHINPDAAFNDGKCDNRGRLWAGSMGKESAPGEVVRKVGTFFVVSSCDGRLEADKKLDNVDISNGLAWSPDYKTLFYIDSLSLGVDAFDFDGEQARISNRRRIFDFKKNGVDGFPDGMTSDSRGHLWVACFASGQVIEINPGPGAQEDAATLESSIKFDAQKITSVTFGGDNYEDMYVTSCDLGDESYPGPGSLFRVTGLNGVRGFPPNKFILK